MSEIESVELGVAEEKVKRGRKSKELKSIIPESIESSDRIKKLELVRAEIEKKFGKGSLMQLGEDSLEKVPTYPSNILSLDEALGGGIGIGRIVEIYGMESAGKSLIANTIVAEVQRQGKLAAYIDAEQVYDPLFASKVGVDILNLEFNQPSSAEEAYDIIEKLASSGIFGIIVLDSCNALSPQKELDGEMGDANVGLASRLISQFLRKVTSILAKTNTTLIIISQIRSKIGVVFGSPEVVGVGNSVKFYASQRLDIRKVETIVQNEESIANLIRIKVTKNKIAAPFKKSELEIVFDKGINKIKDLLNQAVKYGIVEKSGSWYSFGEERLGQGSDNCEKLLTSNPELYTKIYDLTKEAMNNKQK